MFSVELQSGTRHVWRCHLYCFSQTCLSRKSLWLQYVQKTESFAYGFKVISVVEMDAVRDAPGSDANNPVVPQAIPTNQADVQDKVQVLDNVAVS